MPRSDVEHRPELRVRLAADTASVPGARRFVRDGLSSWQLEEFIDDTSLCVTEMAANSALHSGSRFMDVMLRNLPETVLVSVEDAGGLVPVQAVVPQHGHSESASPPIEDLPVTGRGLSIVSMLSREWGIDETGSGRRIWAEIDAGDTEHSVRPPSLHVPAARTADSGHLPHGWKLVRMPACPVDLALRTDQHLDDLVRELQLIDSDEAGARPPREVAELVQRVLARPAFARHVGRRIGQDAAAAGLEEVDIELPAPADLGETMRELAAALALADEVCAAHEHLLTLAATPQMRALRAWFTDSVVGQLEHDAEPVSFAQWSADLD